VANFLAEQAPATLLLTAGGIGDGTVRSRIADIARQVPWPHGFTSCIRRNEFIERWYGREDAVEGPRCRVLEQTLKG
jgi:hypothetical protein